MYSQLSPKAKSKHGHVALAAFSLLLLLAIAVWAFPSVRLSNPVELSIDPKMPSSHAYQPPLTVRLNNYGRFTAIRDSCLAHSRFDTSFWDNGKEKVCTMYAEAFAEMQGEVGHGVPKIVHQSWKTATVERGDFGVWRRSWTETNPGYEYWFWTDEDNRNLVEAFYPELLETYDVLPWNIVRVDFVRALYMHQYGGVYADLDTFCLRPVDTLFTPGVPRVYVAEMGPIKNFKHNIPNAWLASAPNHPFWMFFVKHVVNLANDVVSGKRNWPGTEGIAGPIMLKRAVDGWNDIHGADETTKSLIDSIYDTSPSVEVIEQGKVFVLDWHAKGADTTKMSAKDALGIVAMCARAGRVFELCPPRELNDSVVLTQCRKGFPDAVVLTYWTHSWQ